MNFFRRSILFPTAALMLLAGCQPKKPAPPLPSPTTLFAVDYYLGTPLSGPTNVVDPKVQDAWGPVGDTDADTARIRHITDLQRKKSDAQKSLQTFDDAGKAGTIPASVTKQAEVDPDVAVARFQLYNARLKWTDVHNRKPATDPDVIHLAEQQDVLSKQSDQLLSKRRAEYYQQYLKDSGQQLLSDLNHANDNLKEELSNSEVHVTFVALENPPATSFPPVGSRAVFFSSSGGGSAVLPAAELTRNATINQLNFPEDLEPSLRSHGAGRMTTMASLAGALNPGVTADFTALDPDSVEDPVTGTPTRRCVEVLVSQPIDSKEPPQLALVVKDFIKSRDNRSILRTEKAIFNLPIADRSHTALIVPFRFDSASSRAVAILVQIGPGTTNDSHVASTIDCLKKVSAKLASAQPVPGTGEANSRSTVTAAVQSLTPVAGRRSSLAFLADQTNASICEDLAMEADDAVLAQLVQSIQANVFADKSPQPEVGWLLDHTALQLLAKMSDDAANGTAKMPAELTAILTTHTGEVGRHSSSLDELLKGVASRAELDNRLLAENTIFLEDSNPASRVRAFDWLSARHHAPAGYDPLGKGKDRRDALERAAGSAP